MARPHTRPRLVGRLARVISRLDSLRVISGDGTKDSRHPDAAEKDDSFQRSARLVHAA